MVKFMDMLISNRIDSKRIDDFIEIWHNSSTNETLIEFLGMTEKEYNTFILDPGCLDNLVVVRNKNLTTASTGPKRKMT